MNKILANIVGQVISSNSQEAFQISNGRHLGERKNDQIQYSIFEALYLVKKGKMKVVSKGKEINEKDLVKKFGARDKKLLVKGAVFNDLRDKGYVVKSALKFGAEFRVYDKGSKPKESHAKWIVFTDHESKKMTWHEFSSKNRVAHSTKKNLLIAIVDEEEDITYYEVKWTKP